MTMKSPRLEVRVGTAALVCPAERIPATASAQSSLEIASAILGKRRPTHFVSVLVFALTILALVPLYPALPARAEQQSPAEVPQPASEDKKQSDQPPTGVAGELVKETREAAGEEQEENASLK